MKAEIVLESDNSVDEYDDYQHELTNELANNFVEDDILPLLEEFDYNNECSEYIPGVATFCLFARLVIQFLNEGYTIEDLKKIIDDFSEHCVDGTVH